MKAPIAPYLPVRSILLGIVAPLVCIGAQFVVLNDLMFEVPGLGLLNRYPVFTYGFIGLEMIVLAAWLALGERVGLWSGMIAGVLLIGALFAGALGVILFPFSMIGLLMVIGILGFVPLFTASVFFANGLRALYLASTRIRRPGLWTSILLGATLAAALPAVPEVILTRRIEQAADGIVRGEPMATAMLWGLPPFLYQNRLALMYQDERDPARRDRLARAYEDLCGDDIETRRLLIAD